MVSVSADCTWRTLFFEDPIMINDIGTYIIVSYCSRKVKKDIFCYRLLSAVSLETLHLHLLTQKVARNFGFVLGIF